MTTRLELVERIRLELGDGMGPNYVWSDALLAEYVREALREWSLVRPARRQVSMLGAIGQRDFVLNAEVVPNGVVSVEWPLGVLLAKGATQAQAPRWGWDVVTASTGSFWFYEQAYELVENGTQALVRLRYPLTAAGTNEPIVITYLAYYAAPQQDSDVLEVASADETALVWFVCGRAYRWLDEQRAKRGVYAPSVMTTLKNSGTQKGASSPAAQDYEQRYAALAASRWLMRGVRCEVLTPES
jgi:hypothetical protein